MIRRRIRRRKLKEDLNGDGHPKEDRFSQLNLIEIPERARPVFPQGIMGSKQEVCTSDQWDLVRNTSSLESEGRNYTVRQYRDAANAIHNVLKHSFSKSKMGVISVLAMGIALQNLKEHLRILHTVRGKRQFGERRERIRILKFYNMTEYIFDHHSEPREMLINFIECRIKYTEDLMRNTAKEFHIEIPLRAEHQYFDENQTFEERMEEFLESKRE